MSTTTKIQHKGKVTIPTRIREQAGLNKGDLVEFTFQRGTIVITPKVIIDRSDFPDADDEYTPRQRRILDSRLAKADEDIKAGRVYGPFKTAEEMADSIEANIKKARRAKKKATSAR